MVGDARAHHPGADDGELGALVGPHRHRPILAAGRPTSRLAAALQRLGQVGRQVARQLHAAAVDRVGEREARRVQELAAEADLAAGDAVERGRRSRGGRSRPGGRGSGACGPSRASGAAGSSPRAARASSKCVTAGRSARPPTAMRPTSLRSRPIGASIVPRREGGRPRTSATYSRSICARAHLLAERRVGLVAARHHEQAGGVAVEPVDHAGPLLVVAAAQAEAAQRGDQRRPDDAGRGVRDDARRACRRRSRARR